MSLPATAESFCALMAVKARYPRLHRHGTKRGRESVDVFGIRSATHTMARWSRAPGAPLVHASRVRRSRLWSVHEPASLAICSGGRSLLFPIAADARCHRPIQRPRSSSVGRFRALQLVIHGSVRAPELWTIPAASSKASVTFHGKRSASGTARWAATPVGANASMTLRGCICWPARSGSSADLPAIRRVWINERLQGR